jgi:CO dehydrogenase/acetyl-CoA synthase gamma subunit (corrinoid Fe-S protein)
MGLTGLEIYKHLPKTNCKDCGSPTCLAFAMALASGKASLDACPHVTDEAKEALDSASAPPIKLVKVGPEIMLSSSVKKPKFSVMISVSSIPQVLPF